MKTINGALLKVKDNKAMAWDAPTGQWTEIDVYTVEEIEAAENASEELKARLAYV